MSLRMRMALLPPKRVSRPAPAVLVSGILAQTPALADAAETALEREFGPIDRRSPDVPFNYTNYYETEMGPGLVRRWVAFARPVEPGRLAQAKLATNRLEQEFAEEGKRKVNLDPGLLSLHSLILATTKDFAHRVYLGEGIFAEVTLLFESGEFRVLPWTYPDYRSATCLEFLARCRKESRKSQDQSPGGRAAGR